MMRSRLLALVFAAVFCLPTGLLAQPAASNEAARWREVATRLEPAAFVSIRLKDGARFRGTVLGASDNALSIKPKTRIPVPARDVMFDDLASLERAKQGMNPGQKVLVGTGAIVGGLMVVMAILFAGMD